MDVSLNYVELVETNPITRLSKDYNNKFITKIKEFFTETQQQLFVSSFYCYLNHHPINDYVIDLDNIWKWLGFNQKYNAKRLLEKFFVIDKDYKVLLIRTEEQTSDGRGGHNKQTILLNIKTFKLFCIKADTKKANEIHEYFVKLEELLHQIVQEETDELRLQLQKKEEELNKQKEENKLIQIAKKVPTIYIYNTDINVENNPLLKIGVTNCIVERVKPYKQVNPYGKVVYHKEIDGHINIKTLERSIHDKLSKFRVNGEVFRIDVEEAITCVLLEYTSYKIFSNNTESQRKHIVKTIHNKVLNLDEEPKEVQKIHTCDASTQTDFDVSQLITMPIIQENQEIISKFDKFIEEFCIIRPDVEVSAKDIVGLYRLHIREAKKEITQAFTDYLKRKFVYGKLKQQDKDQVVMGFIGVKIKTLEYKRSLTPSEEEIFVFEKCIFTPSGTALYKDIWDEYQDWKRITNRNIDNILDQERLKKFLKSSPYLLFETVWSVNGGGQGFYGCKLKKDERYQRKSSTGCKVIKMDDNDNILCEYETIAKAAEVEQISAAKMSRSIKNKTIFKLGDIKYYYIKNNIK